MFSCVVARFWTVIINFTILSSLSILFSFIVATNTSWSNLPLGLARLESSCSDSCIVHRFRIHGGADGDSIATRLIGEHTQAWQVRRAPVSWPVSRWVNGNERKSMVMSVLHFRVFPWLKEGRTTVWEQRPKNLRHTRVDDQHAACRTAQVSATWYAEWVGHSHWSNAMLSHLHNTSMGRGKKEKKTCCHSLGACGRQWTTVLPQKNSLAKRKTDTPLTLPLRDYRQMSPLNFCSKRFPDTKISSYL